MRRWILAGALLLLALGFAGTAPAQEPSCQLSTHMLDTSRGVPAADVRVTLSRLAEDGLLQPVAGRRTDRHGRLADLLPPGGQPNDGVYRLRFETAPYFEALGERSIYPWVEVVFRIEGRGHYHIPITMSANGYATYRGN